MVTFDVPRIHAVVMLLRNLIVFFSGFRHSPHLSHRDRLLQVTET